MLNPQEVRQQKFEHFKKQVLMVFTTALRAPLMLMMGCGYVNPDGIRRHAHDYKGELKIDKGYHTEPYDKEKHGEIIGFIEEGERVPDLPNSTQGKAPIHRHEGKNSSGPYHFRYE